MDNYLSHRWPQGPGVQPPPVPSRQAAPVREKPKGRVRRWLVPTVCVILCLALLGGISFWAVNGIAGILADAGPTLPEDPHPWISRNVSSSPDWTPEDLPWGRPDPSVQVAVQPAGPVLSGRQAYQAALPSMVCVEATHAPKDRWRGVEYSTGTGIVVTGTGHVLTNYHIIEEAVSIRLQLLSGPQDYYSAQVIGFDEEFDLAVLKFDPPGVELVPAPLGSSDELAVGDRVYAVGNPMGYLMGSMTEGIVSALGRDEDESGSALGLIQVSASINPGNSGGALLNESGQVVGITCAKITGLVREDGEAVDDAVVLEGLGLAIPMSDAVPFVNHILATGETWRPAMGVTCFATTVDGRQGIQVAEVTDGVPANAAGLRKGDLIVSANGSAVASLVDLRRVLYRTGVDGELTCTVLRDGAEQEIVFTLIDNLKLD